MRLFLIVLYFLCCLPLLSHGQLSRTMVGISVFPSVENLINPDAPKDVHRNRPKLSYNFGLKTKTSMSRHLSINTGLMVYNKGRSYISMLLKQPNQHYSSVELSSNAWYLSVPLLFQYHLALPGKHSLSPAAGVIYGRKIFQYFHQAGPSRNFYTIVSDGSSEDYFGLTLSLSYLFRTKGKVFEISPAYMRQINAGWKYTKPHKPSWRHDSYLLDISIFGIIAQIFQKL